MRDRFNAFVDRHDIAWELAMAFLAVVYVAVGFALDDASAPLSPILEATETGLTIIFAMEFASRFLASRNRGQYLRGHWIDLVALIPATRVSESPVCFGSSDSFGPLRAYTARSGTQLDSQTTGGWPRLSSLGWRSWSSAVPRSTPWNTR